MGAWNALKWILDLIKHTGPTNISTSRWHGTTDHHRLAKRHTKLQISPIFCLSPVRLSSRISISMKYKIYFNLKGGFWTTEQQSSSFSPCATSNPSDAGPWIGTALILGKWQFQLLSWRHLCVTWLLMHWHQRPQSSLMLVGLFLIIHLNKITIEPFQQWASAASSPCGCRWSSSEPLSSQQSFVFCHWPGLWDAL